MDVFMLVSKCQFQDHKGAKLKVTWCVQGIHNWWFAVQEKVTISADMYDDWYPYQPKGNVRI